MVLLTSIKCKIPSKALHFKVQTVFYILIIMLLITDKYKMYIKMYMKFKELKKFIFWDVFTIHTFLEVRCHYILNLIENKNSEN